MTFLKKKSICDFLLTRIFLVLICGYCPNIFATMDSTGIIPPTEDGQLRVLSNLSTPFPDLFFTSINKTIYTLTQLDSVSCAASDVPIKQPYMNTKYTMTVKSYTNRVYYECDNSDLFHPRCSYVTPHDLTAPKLTEPSTTEPISYCASYPCNINDGTNPNIPSCPTYLCKVEDKGGWYSVYIYKPDPAGTVSPTMCATHGWKPAPVQ